jgi:hypothetical protein
MKENGGPAFPELGNVGYKSEWQSESGMTLRDWFAGQALIGMLSNPNIERHPDAGAFRLSKFAYFQADAMLEERYKETL